MAKNKKITESQMLARLQPGTVVLAPLLVRKCEVLGNGGGRSADAYLELALPGKAEHYRFVLETKTRSTPQGVQLAVAQARAAVRQGEHPMIQVPYLSPEWLEKLERQGVSGVDLCGNGVIVVPDRLWIQRSGQPNRYRESRALIDPYRGRSAMVGRALMQRPSWSGLNALAEWTKEQGARLSLSQVSKAVRAMEEDLVVSRAKGSIVVSDPQRLLDQLGRGWGRPSIGARQFLTLPGGRESLADLSAIPSLKWTVTGQSAGSRYVVHVQGGPQQIAVTDVASARIRLGGVIEPVPSFADVELLETHEPGFYFGCETDEKGIRWASRLQTWLELQNGDARQQEAAQELRRQILKGVSA